MEGMVQMKEIRSESKLTFFEATSIIVGHGVGSGILSVPFLASRNRWYDILWIILQMCIRDRGEMEHSLICEMGNIMCGSYINALAAVTVSYTHLDVYKRQGTGGIISAPSFGTHAYISGG